MEAISHAGSAVAILTKEGVVLGAEKKVTSKLLESGTKTEKLYKIDPHLCCAVAGITADANILIEYSRLVAQRYLYQYQEPVPVEYLVGLVCDYKQGYTQYGGMYYLFILKVNIPLYLYTLFWRHSP
jgi:20S proteasome subunit alpha 3